MSNLAPLMHYNALKLRQRKELAELFGYESRNKYEVIDPNGQVVLYAAEQGKGLAATIMRQFVGHWRTFEITVFDRAQSPVMRAVHPFRFFFQRLEVFAADGRPIGAIQQRFALFSKAFDVLDAAGNVRMTVRSPIWRPWTFSFQRDGRELGVVAKKWSGLVKEAFTDADTFRVEFGAPELTPDERAIMLAAGIFIDLQYFEVSASA